MNNFPLKGLLIYDRNDYIKNQWFAGELINKASLFGLELSLAFHEQISLSIENNDFKTYIFSEDMSYNTLSPGDISFVINRSRDALLGKHFEKMGCKVFNNSIVTEICNHKGKTHQLINSAGISSASTLICNKNFFNIKYCPFSYPIILKAVSGHGGSEVFWVNSDAEFNEKLSLIHEEDFIIQKPCKNPGTDIRVFTLGKQIIAAVKRYNPQSFKSNYSLGGSASAYQLSANETNLVNKILNLLDFDLIGIDFILDDKGNFLFNEIEDAVGTRTLYLNYKDIDIVMLYLEYIAKKINPHTT